MNPSTKKRCVIFPLINLICVSLVYQGCVKTAQGIAECPSDSRPESPSLWSEFWSDGGPNSGDDIEIPDREYGSHIFFYRLKAKVSQNCAKIDNSDWVLNMMVSKGPYPLGDMSVVGHIIDWRRLFIRHILSVIPLWVWPVYMVTGQLITRRSPLPGNGKTADLYQACLIFHC